MYIACQEFCALACLIILIEPQCSGKTEVSQRLREMLDEKHKKRTYLLKLNEINTERFKKALNEALDKRYKYVIPYYGSLLQPGRFKILNQCVTVTGVVLTVQYEPDGDTEFSLALDPPYKNMVTQANFNPLMRGGIWSEMICQHP